MLRYFVLVLGLILLAVTSFTVSAADDTDKGDRRFTGLYIGAGGGYGDYSSGGSGGYAEVFLGLRKQTRTGLVYGLEGTANLFDTSETDGDEFLDFDGALGILAKVGYTPDNRFLYYGGIGYTSIDVNDAIREEQDTADGVLFEAGIEYMATSFLGFRVRGQYHASSGEADVANVGGALILSF